MSKWPINIASFTNMGTLIPGSCYVNHSIGHVFVVHQSHFVSAVAMGSQIKIPSLDDVQPSGGILSAINQFGRLGRNGSSQNRRTRSAEDLPMNRLSWQPTPRSLIRLLFKPL